MRTGRTILRWTTGFEGLEAVVGLGLSGWLVTRAFAPGAEASVLLVAWWALRLPALGAEVIAAAREIPDQRNVLVRVLEPIGAPLTAVDASPSPHEAMQGGVEIELDAVSVVAAGKPILTGVSVKIAAGEHVAVVGPSGAGKSSLLGLLLGWHVCAEGTLRVDGAPLIVHDGALVEDGPPEALAAQPGSRYGALLSAEQRLREALWGAEFWRRIEVTRDGIRERSP